MPQPLTPRVRNLVELYLFAELSPEWIATDLSISKRSVFRIKRNIETYGIAQCQPQFDSGGRPRTITPPLARALEQYLLRDPCVYQDEMALYLMDEFGIGVHQSTISRVLRRIRFSRKIARRHSYTQSMILRAQWISETHDLLPEQCVFVDESAFNQRTGWRRCAWPELATLFDIMVMLQGKSYSCSRASLPYLYNLLLLQCITNFIFLKPPGKLSSHLY